MRARIPLVLVLALFVTVSCDQQPTEPLQQEAGPALFASHGNGPEVSTSEFTFDFNLCGYTDVTCDVRAHTVFFDRRDAEAKGGYHLVYHSTWRGTCTSPDTGETWRLQDDVHQTRQGDDPGHFMYVSAGVGIGHAPSFKARWNCPYYVVDGSPVIDFDNCNPFFTCEEFGN